MVSESFDTRIILQTVVFEFQQTEDFALSKIAFAEHQNIKNFTMNMYLCPVNHIKNTIRKTVKI